MLHEEGAITMDTLPDEMLLHIFSFISTFELSTVVNKVSCRWQRLINRTILRIRKAVDLDKLYEGLKAVIVTDTVLLLDDASTLVTCIVVLAVNLEELSISRDYPLTDEDFRYLIYLPHLKHLDVFSKKKCVDSNTFINPSITSLVVNDSIGVGFLKNVALSNQLRAFHMFGRCQVFAIKEMMNFLQVQAPYLRDLTLRCTELTDERYRIIGQCVELVNLQLYTCALLTKNGASYFEDLINLRRFHLTGTTMLRQSGMHKLVASLPRHVEELNLSCSQFGDEHCGALAARLPDLRALELWRAALAPDGLLRLARRLPALRALDTDLTLRSGHLHTLPLRRLRCRRRPPPPPPHAPRRPRRPRPRAAPDCARECLRGDDEGPSAERYYHWTRGATMRALGSPRPDLAQDQIIVDVEDFCEDDLRHDDERPERRAAAHYEHVPIRKLVRSNAPNWAVVYVRNTGEGGGEGGGEAGGSETTVCEGGLPRGYTFVLEDDSARYSTIIHKMFNWGGLYRKGPAAALACNEDDDAQDVIVDEDNSYIDVVEHARPVEAEPASPECRVGAPGAEGAAGPARASGPEGVVGPAGALGAEGPVEPAGASVGEGAVGPAGTAGTAVA